MLLYAVVIYTMAVLSECRPRQLGLDQRESLLLVLLTSQDSGSIDTW